LSGYVVPLAFMNPGDSSVKEQIIQTANRLFYQQGYNLTGINQIIREAGVAKASLYYHFQSKEDLCVAYLHRRNGYWFNGLQDYLTGTSDPKKLVMMTFEYRIIHMKKSDFGGCSCIKIISEMPQRDEKIDGQVILQKKKQWSFFFTLVQRLKGIRKKEMVPLTDKIFFLFEGGTVQCQVYRNEQPLQAAKKAAGDLLRKY
jgi:hypothetical protein